MSFVNFVALRYLSALKRRSFISIISAFSIAGVSIGVASLIIVMGVMTGFTTDLRNKILGANAHILVFSHAGNITDYNDAIDIVENVQGVAGVTPFIYSEVMISAHGSVKGLALRGIDPKGAGKVLSIFQLMTEGSLEDLIPPVENDNDTTANQTKKIIPRIIIGKELAKRLSIGVGSRVSLLSPSGNKNAAGFQPKIAPFEIAGIFSTGMIEYDVSMAFISLENARELLSVPDNQVFGLEVLADNVDKADLVSQNINKELSSPLYSRHWMDMNGNLFAALQLEKMAMGVILSLIVLVGSFSIVTSLVMLVMEKKRDIAILMSMGATKQNMRNIFMLQGIIIGLIGTVLGNILGIGIAYVIEKYQLIKLPEGAYPTTHLTILINYPDVLIISGSAMLICFLATLYPSKQASSLKPVEALRQE
ncbi:ABC transporter permease [Desulfovibrio litoralis]|uniref:Lipoprotein-releasing system permease protein n=1 Tax=Desulfovibrio litoralis DSM 11393 TaxID=1121455 RepID=A0A1M7TMX0_9BACT|nr:ABC transporter permease [Desulfovibrio litoralis]SHN72101.1 lipoprotein-releasing system permease protein [Desulfovibrio litoralis DSM 11393]